jgi:hypothetical protein
MNAALKELTDTIAKMGGAYDALVYANPHD